MTPLRDSPRTSPFLLSHLSGRHGIGRIYLQIRRHGTRASAVLTILVQVPSGSVLCEQMTANHLLDLRSFEALTHALAQLRFSLGFSAAPNRFDDLMSHCPDAS